MIKNNYKARTADDIVLDEPKPYSFWRGKSIRKIIDGYEVLIFLDKLGSTGICIRKEESTKQKDYILVGELFQNCRGDKYIADSFNQLCSEKGCFQKEELCKWTIAPISVYNGYNSGLLLWAPRWYDVADSKCSHDWRTINYWQGIWEFAELAKAKGFFVGSKKQSGRKSITELNFFI